MKAYVMSEMPASYNSSERHGSWLVLAALFVAQIIFALTLNPIGARDSSISEWLAQALMGALFCQPVLLAIWAALGPGRSVVRIPLSFSAMIVIGFAGVLSNWSVVGHVEWERDDLFAYLLIGSCCFVVTLLVMLVVKRFSGWRIDYRSHESLAAEQYNRFSVRYLLVLTAIASLLLMIGRVLTRRMNSTSSLYWPGAMSDAVLTGGALILSIFPVLMIPLVIISRCPSVRAAIAMLLAWTIITWAAVEAWNAINGSRKDVASAVVLMQLGAVLIAALSAVVVRLAGYRLYKRVK